MEEVQLGTIMAFGFQFQPRGWLKCDGQSVKISDYKNLYNLIGTTYGGDGKKYFMVPDLRGRVPVHIGKEDGFVPGKIGETIGEESIALNDYMFPPHTHGGKLTGLKGKFNCSGAKANTDSPKENSLASVSRSKQYYDKDNNDDPDTYMKGGEIDTDGGVTLGYTGGKDKHPNMQPSLAVNYCISWAGHISEEDSGKGE